MWIRIREGLAKSGLDRKGIVGRPIPWSVELMAPYWTLSKKRHTIAVTMAGTMDGKKKIARKTDRPAIRVFSRLATRKEEITPSGALNPT